MEPSSIALRRNHPSLSRLPEISSVIGWAVFMIESNYQISYKTFNKEGEKRKSTRRVRHGEIPASLALKPVS